MVAALVEQVSDMPLGDTFFVSDMYTWIFDKMVTQIRKMFSSRFLPSCCSEADENWGSRLEIFVLTAGLSNHAKAAVANQNWLPHVWKFVVKHANSGLIGVFFASYLTFLKMPSCQGMGGLAVVLQSPVYFIDTQNQVPEMLDLASSILNHEEFVLNSGATGTFTQLLDETIASFANEYRP